jgi:argininosuccinate synthase
MRERIVFAYSGSLEAAMTIPWLAETCHAEVVALTLDLGQGRELEEVRDRALAAGAARAHVLDVREEFTHDYVLPALQAGALDQERHPIAIPLARPLIAKKLVEIAAIEQARTVAHGAATEDSPSIEAAVHALHPDLHVIAAGRERGTARMHGNLWGRSMERGSGPPSERAYTVTTAPANAPATAAFVEIAFEQGVPKAINGVPMPLTELIESIAIIAGQHGIGRIGPTSDSHDIHEAPAAVVLHAAHKELESHVLPVDLRHLKRQMSAEYANLVLSGGWFSPVREALDASNHTLQARVTGIVSVRLLRGQQTITVPVAHSAEAAHPS